jgi:hypothetical protein
MDPPSLTDPGRPAKELIWKPLQTQSAVEWCGVEGNVSDLGIIEGIELRSLPGRSLNNTKDEGKWSREDAGNLLANGPARLGGRCPVCVKSICIRFWQGQKYPNAEKVCTAICCVKVLEGAGRPPGTSSGAHLPWPASPVHSLKSQLGGPMAIH